VGVEYGDIAAGVAATGMVARGGFVPVESDRVPTLDDGRSARTVVVIGNIGSAMWPKFRSGEQPGPNPLDAWTRRVLAPVAASLGATFLHPSDEPFQPFQQWAQRADDVWPSPIGLLVHATHGLWHAYRGAFLFADDVDGVPPVGGHVSPCLGCRDQPCLSACPVDAFSSAGYDADSCAGHVAAGDDPRCLSAGCAARIACPVAPDLRYGSDQMYFHMQAFVGARRP
jgi:hypothetical protein